MGNHATATLPCELFGETPDGRRVTLYKLENDGHGYDQCFVLQTEPGAAVQLAAWARDPDSGRKLEIYSDQPSIQLYSGNRLNGALAGHGGVIYRQSDGFALEPQGFPDAPHHPNFPSTILRPGQHYRRMIRYRFITD